MSTTTMQPETTTETRLERAIREQSIEVERCGHCGGTQTNVFADGPYESVAGCVACIAGLQAHCFRCYAEWAPATKDETCPRCEGRPVRVLFKKTIGSLRFDVLVAPTPDPKAPLPKEVPASMPTQTTAAPSNAYEAHARLAKAIRIADLLEIQGVTLVLASRFREPEWRIVAERAGTRPPSVETQRAVLDRLKSREAARHDAALLAALRGYVLVRVNASESIFRRADGTELTLVPLALREELRIARVSR